MEYYGINIGGLEYFEKYVNAVIKILKISKIFL